MTVYITVGAKRIQDWIVRTPRLKLLRGASDALQAITTAGGKDMVAACLDENPDIGAVLGKVTVKTESQVDGVIEISCTPSPAADADTRDDGWREAACALIEALVAKLQNELPGLEWHGSAVVASTRTQAKVAALQGGPQVLPASFPASDIDLPFAESCGGCGLELVEESSFLEIPEDERRELEDDDDESDTTPRRTPRAQTPSQVALGPDCARRLSAFEEASQKTKTKSRPAWSLYRLAGLGRSPAGGRNHLAVVQADGNRVGELMKSLSTSTHAKDHPEVLEEASTALHASMQHAIGEAKKAVEACIQAADISPAGPEFDPVLTLYTGGDDLLATVPAALGWNFAIALGQSFGPTFRDRVSLALADADLGADEDLRRKVEEASLGIGLVFGHHSYPFAQSYRVATRAMKQAKALTQGREDAITWVDLTVESEPPSGRYAIVADLAEQLARTSQPAADPRDQTFKDDVLVVNEGSARRRGWTNSQAATVAQMVRDHWKPQPADPAWPDSLASAHERKDNRDSGLDAQLRSFSQARPDPLWQALTDERNPPTHADIRELTNLMNRRRWWPSTAN